MLYPKRRECIIVLKEWFIVSLFPAESFNSLLKSYTPSSQVASPTMADVLQELPEQTDYSPSSPEVDRRISDPQVNTTIKQLR